MDKLIDRCMDEIFRHNIYIYIYINVLLTRESLLVTYMRETIGFSSI